MRIISRRAVPPLSFMLGSFSLLLLLALFTNPLDKIIYAVGFFIILLVFLASLGYGLALLQSGEVSRKSRERIFGVSIFIVVLLMFRSVGSLGWGGLILLLIIGGWLFYVSHRA